MPTAAGIYYFAHQEHNYARPPILLIHGAGGHHLFWPPEIRRLQGQRIFAVDLPGHGKSAGVGKQTIDEYSQAIVEFMDNTSLRKAIFVGHSMGSAIALNLAIHHPTRTIALALLSGGARLRVDPEILAAAAIPATSLLAIQKIHENGFPEDFDPRLRALSAQRMADTRPAVLYGDLLACENFDRREELGKVRVRTLVLCGSADRMTPYRFSEYLHNHVRSAELKMFEGAGHMLMIERPAEVSEALQDFFATIPYRPGA